MEKSNIRNLVGQRFGKLLVIKIADKNKWKTQGKKKRVSWLCKCDCGNEVIYSTPQLCYDGYKSCGCINKEKQHFACKSLIHKTWSSMLTRCYNTKRKFYYLYGGRGITVCEDWLGSNPKGFSNFYEWSIHNGYKEELLNNHKNKLTLDRIDCDKGYSPDNCRWITNEEQQSNKRADKKFNYNGETKTIKQWLKQFYFKCNDYYRLLRIGLTNEQVLNFISLPETSNLQLLRKDIIGERYTIENGNKRLFDKFLNKFVSISDFI